MLSVKLLSQRVGWLRGTVSQSDVWSADLTCRHSRWDCIQFHLTTPERYDVWSPTGDGRTVLSEPERSRRKKKKKSANLHFEASNRVVWPQSLNYHLKTSSQHRIYSSLLPPLHSPARTHTNTRWQPTSSSHKYLTSFSPPLAFLPPRQSASRPPAPLRCGCTPLWQTHSSQAPSRPAVLPEHPGCHDTEQEWERQPIRQDIGRSTSTFYLYRSRMWRLPCTVPRMTCSDTRWSALTCSSVVNVDSRRPFTE